MYNNNYWHFTDRATHIDTQNQLLIKNSKIFAKKISLDLFFKLIKVNLRLYFIR